MTINLGKKVIYSIQRHNSISVGNVYKKKHIDKRNQKNNTQSILGIFKALLGKNILKITASDMLRYRILLLCNYG